MAETVVEIPMAVPIKKARTSRKTLKEKSSWANEANILAGQMYESSPAPVPTQPEDAGKEYQESLSQPRSGKKKSKGAGNHPTVPTKEDHLQEGPSSVHGPRLHYSSAPSLSGLHGCPFYAFLCFLFHGYAWASFNAPAKRGQVFGPFNSSSFNVKYLIFIKIPFPNNYPKLRFSTNFQNSNSQLIFKTPIFK